ncbi:septal ring lytic transglycosylase RlpA family protein [Granulicella sp. WH15]|uniref:septal ring lytic transglycosylase RlpA family protein n=1 Tax=Granulicella sp. WH15 TaxID=2602070 RepID=UPI001367880A|nr:septal ring lytic transglycosylase RlpA family protein [Granulicella sp. WH15]QHN04673.1 septal ring lytic transglycosylase RlpA family protein [Granulicella sp. WH15]
MSPFPKKNTPPNLRTLAPLLLALLLVVLTGCHHKQQTAYVPPPPPINSTSRPAYRPAPSTQGSVAPRPALPPDDLNGKPVSTEIGLASWYGPPYHNRQAADGSIFDQNAMTAAHRTLPMGTTVRVTNLATNESVVVKITDRGPFVQGRVLDLSLAAAKATGIYRAGVAKVKIEAFAHNTADPAGRWCVQIGAFLDQSEAVQLKNDLMRRYANAKVIEFAGPTGHWVRINPAQSDRQHAEQIADSIHIPDAEPYLTRLN